MSLERPRVVLNMHFLCPVKLMLIRISNVLQDISPVNRLKTFYIDIKTIERIKKQTMFQRKMADFKGK